MGFKIYWNSILFYNMYRKEGERIKTERKGTSWNPKAARGKRKEKKKNAQMKSRCRILVQYGMRCAGATAPSTDESDANGSNRAPMEKNLE